MIGEHEYVVVLRTEVNNLHGVVVSNVSPTLPDNIQIFFALVVSEEHRKVATGS